MPVFKVQNGPFDTGKDAVYVEACSSTRAKEAATASVSDFTAAGADEVGEAPDNAEVHKAERRSFVLSEEN